MKDNNITPQKTYLKSLGKKHKDLTTEERREYHRIFREHNLDRVNQKQIEWNKKNAERIKMVNAKYQATYADTRLFARWFYVAKVRVYGKGHTGSFDEVVGCSEDEFKKHIESQFTEGMSWDNWGAPRGKGTSMTVWHIDHIVDVKDGGDNHYTNLRPLWAYANYIRNYIDIENML